MLRTLIAVSVVVLLAIQPVIGQQPSDKEQLQKLQAGIERLKEVAPQGATTSFGLQELLAEIEKLQGQVKELIKRENESILSERDRFILEKIMDRRTGKLIRLQTVEFRQLNVDKQEGRVTATGPGHVDSFCRNDNDPSQGRLTRVEFSGQFSSVTRENTRESAFYDNVEVYEAPAASPDIAFNRTSPPRDGFYLRCHLLKISSRPVAGKTVRFMEAKKQVTFQTAEFFGRADIVKLDESDDIVVFEATPGNIVIITMVGAEGRVIRGEKVLYNRRTGEFDLEKHGKR